MKNILKAVLSILVSASMFSVSMTALAEEDYEWYTRWYGSYRDDPFTVTTDNFHYSTGIYGITLENDLINGDHMLMITGIGRNEDGVIEFISVTAVNQTYGSKFFTGFTDEQLNSFGEPIQVGDLINYPDGYSATEGIPQIMDPEGRIEYLGHGTDIFGEEFQKVIRHEWLPNPDGVECVSDLEFDVIKGDATEDENVDILDVIMINKAVLGMETMGSYAQYVSDVDGNGTVDSTDSLNVMKYIVGINDSLDVQ